MLKNRHHSLDFQFQVRSNKITSYFIITFILLLLLHYQLSFVQTLSLDWSNSLIYSTYYLCTNSSWKV